MLRSMVRLIVLSMAIASSVPVFAQHRFRDQEPIVVQGTTKEFLRQFIDKMAKVGATDQLGRWNMEVCPAIVGIDSAEARYMRQRIVDLSESVGLRRPDPGCPTSLSVIITSDAAGFVRDLVKLYPITLKTDGLAPLKEFEQTTRPVRWITVTDECSFGCKIGSRITKESAPGFVDMIIVVDANRIAGFTIGELSDYVSVVALSNPPDDGGSSQSILSMFDRPRDPGEPFQISSFDRSFLTGLYNSSEDQGAKVQQQGILSHMKKTVGQH